MAVLFLGVSAALKNLMNLGWPIRNVDYALCNEVASVLLLSTYIGAVAGLVLWTYTPLGRRTFSYWPPKLTLNDRRAGAFRGFALGLCVGIFGPFDIVSIEGVNGNFLFKYPLCTLLSCAICSLAGFLLPYSLPGPN